MSPPDGVGPKETTASGPSEDSGTSVFAVAEDDEELCNLSVSGLSYQGGYHADSRRDAHQIADCDRMMKGGVLSYKDRREPDAGVPG
ncbi:MAG: hypothetical protein MMC33_007275 [Icmadophila ericetorum]|nr:hypothetical protein [Icmadophila ericetorum]